MRQDDEQPRRQRRCLDGAHTALQHVAAAHDLCLEWHRVHGAADNFGSMIAPLPVERLQLARRTIEDTLELNEVKGDEAHIQTMNKQCLQAYAAHDDTEKRIKDEKYQLYWLKHYVSNEKNWVEHNKRKQKEFKDATDRTDALKKRQAATKALIKELQQESEDLCRFLAESTEKSKEVAAVTRRFEEEHSRAVVENQQARQVLRNENHPNLPSYRRSKAEERARADEHLANAFQELQEEMSQLTARWAVQRDQYHADLEDMQDEVLDLQEIRDDADSEAEDVLAQQAKQHDDVHAEVGQQVAVEMRHLDERRQVGDIALRKEIYVSQQCVNEATVRAQRQIDMDASELHARFRRRAAIETVRCDKAIKADKKTVEQAKRDRQAWEKRADKMRENCHAHAIKSGSYIRHLDAHRKDRLQGLFAQGRLVE